MRLRFTFPVALLFSLNVEAQAPPRPAIPGEVRAIWQKRCTDCHAGKAPKGGLDLSTPEGIARGGRNGPVVTPGKPDASRLWQMVQKEKMPPDEPLPEVERRILRQWIEAGAAGVDPVRLSAHWAFRPPVRPGVPGVRGQGSGVRNPVDAFVLAKLGEKGLTLATEAERTTLLRRVAFDLTGLPPTPQDIDSLLADTAPDAYERMVERYLASPRYGERWGKFWLDAAGYADSNGYFNADSDRPLAWKYRDYVIRAFNADKPYDRFVREQIAGDEIAGYVPGGDVTPAMIEPLTATHFLRNAPDGSGESDGNPDEVRTDRLTVLEGTVQIAMNCLLGVTIQCARCHDHKFEPISQEEYYSLQAILAPAYNPDHWVKPNDRTVVTGTRAQREEHQRLSSLIDQEIKALQANLARDGLPLRIKLVEERLPKLNPDVRTSILQALMLPREMQSKEQQELLKKHVEPLKITDDELAKRFPENAARRARAQQDIARRELTRPRPLEKLSVLLDVVPNPPPHRLLVRGLHNKPGKEVQPGVLAAVSTTSNVYRLDARPASGTGRRGAFARWVTSPDNPLFARVMVNRIWQHHFGVGLVATPDNLGQSGARPSHPELLDWLTVEFIEHGWSIKHLHRVILCSATYRQASAPGKDERLLCGYPLRRLDAEAVRDAMLAVSGELDGRMGGHYVPTTRNGEGVVEVDEKNPLARRRSVYLQQRRTQVTTFLELFDAPSIATTCGVRNTSTVPLQALALLNSDFARRRAESFARRLSAARSDGERITLACRLAWGRNPSDRELVAAQRFLMDQRELKAGDERVWADFCQMLMASNAFLYVD